MTGPGRRMASRKRCVASPIDMKKRAVAATYRISRCSNSRLVGAGNSMAKNRPTRANIRNQRFVTYRTITGSAPRSRGIRFRMCCLDLARIAARIEPGTRTTLSGSTGLTRRHQSTVPVARCSGMNHRREGSQNRRARRPSVSGRRRQESRGPARPAHNHRSER